MRKKDEKKSEGGEKEKGQVNLFFSNMERKGFSTQQKEKKRGGREKKFTYISLDRPAPVSGRAQKRKRKKRRGGTAGKGRFPSSLSLLFYIMSVGVAVEGKRRRKEGKEEKKEKKRRYRRFSHLPPLCPGDLLRGRKEKGGKRGGKE